MYHYSHFSSSPLCLANSTLTLFWNGSLYSNNWFAVLLVAVYIILATDQILIDCSLCIACEDRIPFLAHAWLCALMPTIYTLVSIALNTHGHICTSELRKDASIFSLQSNAIHVVPSNRLQLASYTGISRGQSISIWSVISATVDKFLHHRTCLASSIKYCSYRVILQGVNWWIKQACRRYSAL